MSRLSNLSTLKLGIFKSWNTYWFDRTYYSNILFNDLKLRDYLTGIFYKLKIVSDYYYFYRFLTTSSIISINLIFFSNLRFKSITLRQVYKLGVNYIFFYRKRHWKSFLYYTKLIRRFSVQAPNVVQRGPRASIILPFNYSLFYFLPMKRFSFFCLDNRRKLFRFFSLNGLGKSLRDVSPVENIDYQYQYQYWLNYKSFTKWICKELRFLDQISTFIWYWSIKTFLSYNITQLLEFSKYFLYNSLNSLLNFHSSFQIVSIICDEIYSLSYSKFNLSNQTLVVNYIETGLIPSKIDRRIITKSLFVSFRAQIEQTISLFEQKKVYFNFSIFFKKNPFIISAKLITETLVYLLQSGKKIVPSFFFIRNWQASLYKNKRVLEHTYFQAPNKSINLNYLFYYASKRFPLIGIRIECSGTYKKGRMARIYFYSSWIKDSVLTGRMPNSTMIADIDYYQYFAITKSSSIGIKTWIFLETHLYNSNNKYISIVY